MTGIADVPDDTILFDERVPELSQFLAMCLDVDGDVDGEGIMSVSEIALDLPMECDLYVDDQGGVRLGGGPPTQQIETTFMPVFHRIGLRLAVEEAEAGADHG